MNERKRSPRTESPRPVLWLLLFVAGLSACAGDGAYESRPSPPVRKQPAPTPPPVPESPPLQPSPPTTSLPEPVARPTPPAPPVPLPYAGEGESRALITRLLPAKINEREAWAADLMTAFSALRLPATPDRICAAIAIIEQESSFQTDPPVPGLGQIALREIDRRREKYGIPKFLVDLALLKPSPDGRSYKVRIASLRTEKQMNSIFDDMISEFPYGKTLFGGYNPVRTAGPMQVSVDFAEEQVRSRPYPYPLRSAVRNELFTRRGGVYFGVAMLLDYPVAYSQMLFRFADFNAGRYSSRNAAFQAAIGRLSGHPLDLDGDLLRYKDGSPTTDISATQRAILSLRSRLNLSEGEILRDLKLEKTVAFERSALYQRLYAIADLGQPAPREILPRIDLKSPKIQRPLTTEWFARRVNTRFQSCLARNEMIGPVTGK